MINRTAIVDYGMCNLDSVRRAVEECGGGAYVTSDPLELRAADRIILPGVGAFPEAMANLRSRRLDVALAEEVLGADAPFLGICLGMQLMATVGCEGVLTEGLGWIDGAVVQFAPTADERIPHIGWNEVHPKQDVPLFEGLTDGVDFYFVHSYHFRVDDPAAVMAVTPYCGLFVSAIGRDRMWGVQFHPEKSQQAGFTVLRNFLAL